MHRNARETNSIGDAILAELLHGNCVRPYRTTEAIDAFEFDVRVFLEHIDEVNGLVPSTVLAGR